MKKTLFATAIALLLTGPSVWAQPAPPSEPPAPVHAEAENSEVGMEPPMDTDRLAEALGLSEDQKSKIQQVCVSHARKIVELKGQMSLQKFDLGVFMRQDEPNPEQAKRLAAAVAATHAAIEMEKLQMMLDIKSMLTPEQRKKMRSHPHPGGGPGGRPGSRPGHGPGGPGGGPHHN